MPIPVWLDCDPGHDDVCAILLAGHSPRLNLLGVSTVACNQTVEKTTVNALSTLYVAGLQHIDVYPGAARPLIRPMPLLCPEIHGHSGLDGLDGQPLFPKSPHPPAVVPSLQAHLWQLFKNHFETTNERVVLICTGALTNAALLIASHRDVVEYISIVLMGGAMGIGNTGPVVEFNIQTDPEAAKIVFESGVPLTMVPLECTHTALATPAVMHAVKMGCDLSTAQAACDDSTGQDVHMHTPATRHTHMTPSSNAVASSGHKPGASQATSHFRAKMADLLQFFAHAYKDVFQFDHPPLHDPCAVAYVLAPELFDVHVMRVDIETVSELSTGQTVCDVWHQSTKPKNAHVAKRMDVQGFWQVMLDAIEVADRASPLNK